MTQHTPGPWTAHNFGDDSWEILTATTIVAEVQDNLSSPGNSEANAALIAAAPAMLEALKAVESEITRLERISKQAFSIDEVHPAVDRVAIATRAAIRAAEGK